MNRRNRVLVGVGLVVLALALWTWHRRSGDADRAPTSAATGSSARGNAGPRDPRRVDPRSLERGSLAGTIRNEAGAPIEDARVCVDTYSHDLPPEVTRDPTCTSAAADGGYRFDHLVKARYTVSGGARRYLPAQWHATDDRNRATVELEAGEAKTGIDITLYPGAVEVTGTVSDISGGPIAHALVRASSGRWQTGSSSPVVETDDQGGYTIWVRPGTTTISAVADGYAANTETGHAPGAIDLSLTPESSLAGVVVDAQTGQPIEGARVSVTSSQITWERGGEQARTDAAGAFRVTRLTPGRFVATARTEHGYGRSEGSTRVGLGQQVDGVTVRLFAAARIEGHVQITAAKPAPCKDASVSFHDDEHDRWVSSVTEPDGTVHADGVLPGTYAPQVWCRDYLPREDYPAIVVSTKDVTDQIWEVSEGSTIRGKVTTKSGDPVDDAPIYARSVGGAARAKRGWGSDRTTHTGSYEMKGVRAGSYKIELETERGITPREGYPVEVPAGATIERDLVLDDGGTIKGTVVDAEGKPVANVQVDARALDRSWWGQSDTTTDRAGAFTIESVRPGDYRVVASRGWTALRKPGTTDDSTQGEKIKVKAAQTVSVALRVGSQGGTIKGVVIDADGKPVTDAFLATARESDAAGSNAANTVQATRGWGWGDVDKPVLTGVDGSFTVTDLETGNYTLRAYRKGGGEAVAEHVATGTTTRLQIARTGSIAGTAHRDGGVAPDELKVSVADLKTGFSRNETYFRTAGQFTINDLPRGQFQLTVDAEGGQGKVEVALAEGERKAGVDVVLDALVTLTGRLVDFVTRQPVAGIQVFAQPARAGATMFSWNGDADRDHISDETGRFTVKRVPRTQVAIGGFPKDWQESAYSFFRQIRTITETGTVDLGDLAVVRKRVKEGDPVGELGIHFVDQPADTPPEKEEWKVSWIDPAGPAAKVDLKVGDVLTSVDGADITGTNASNGWVMMQAPPGTKLVFGLARGTTISLLLAAP